MWDFAVIAGATFQSTPPSREATRPQFHHFFRARISIHASLAGGDIAALKIKARENISIHASLAGGDD